MALIAVIHIADGPHPDGVADRISDLPEGYRLVGIYDFPDRMELRRGCTGCTTGKRKIQGWTRHKNGYMMCASCEGRNPNLRRWFTGGLFDWFGANLYRHAPALFRTPEGYGPRDND
jgi:hypothetical protein